MVRFFRLWLGALGSHLLRPAETISFTLEDVSVQNGDPDLKVIVQPTDESSIAASTGPAQYVPASEVTTVQSQLQDLQSRIVQTIDQYKDNYRGQLKFDYRYKQNEAPFNIASIFHDDRFTYIKADAQEKFTLYEVRDGAPNLIRKTPNHRCRRPYVAGIHTARSSLRIESTRTSHTRRLAFPSRRPSQGNFASC